MDHLLCGDNGDDEHFNFWVLPCASRENTELVVFGVFCLLGHPPEKNVRSLWHTWRKNDIDIGDSYGVFILVLNKLTNHLVYCLSNFWNQGYEVPSLWRENQSTERGTRSHPIFNGEAILKKVSLLEQFQRDSCRKQAFLILILFDLSK